MFLVIIVSSCAPSAVEVAASEQHPWATRCNKWKRQPPPMRQEQLEGLKKQISKKAAEAGARRQGKVLLEKQLNVPQD